jgi:hypothetical protein
MEPKTHECSRSLGRLLGRAAAVSAIYERIERIGSSAKEARFFHKLTAKSRPGKNYCESAVVAQVSGVQSGLGRAGDNLNELEKLTLRSGRGPADGIGRAQGFADRWAEGFHFLRKAKL